MKRLFFNAMSEALHSIKTRFFHTLLSVLGIVVGVAALVATLSLIDGLENYAKKQIQQNTNVNQIVILSDSYTMENKLRVKKSGFSKYDIHAFHTLQDSITIDHNAYFLSETVKRMTVTGQDSAQVAKLSMRNPLFNDQKEEMLAGSFISEKNNQMAVVNESLALLIDSIELKTAIGKQIEVDSISYTIGGIIASDEEAPPSAIVSYNSVPDKLLSQHPPTIVLEVDDVEKLDNLKDELESFHNNYFGNNHDFELMTYENYARQAEKGFLLFRLVMGFIVGLSVLVGGIGIMNVLLISVKERTQEIGIRKAIGANRQSIIAQFLGESITISIFGSLIGLVIGLLLANAAVVVLKQFQDVSFHVGYTWQTMGIIALVAILTGILFGTYPAIQASKLDPVEAIGRN